MHSEQASLLHEQFAMTHTMMMESLGCRMHFLDFGSILLVIIQSVH